MSEILTSKEQFRGVEPLTVPFQHDGPNSRELQIAECYPYTRTVISLYAVNLSVSNARLLRDWLNKALPADETCDGAPATFNGVVEMYQEVRAENVRLKTLLENPPVRIEHNCPNCGAALLTESTSVNTSELQDDLTVAREFIRRCVEAVGRDPNVPTVDLLELADQVVGTIEQYKIEAAGTALKANQEPKAAVSETETCPTGDWPHRAGRMLSGSRECIYCGAPMPKPAPSNGGA